MLPAHLERQLSDFDPQELGPHAAALLAEMRRAVRAGSPESGSSQRTSPDPVDT